MFKQAQFKLRPRGRLLPFTHKSLLRKSPDSAGSSATSQKPCARGYEILQLLRVQFCGGLWGGRMDLERLSEFPLEPALGLARE